MTRPVVALLPALTGVHGDTRNALVLARRAEWAGERVAVLDLEAGERVPSEPPLVVVLGSAADSVLPRVREALEALRAPLADWVASGVPLLAIGTGMELLGGRIPLAEGRLDGLGFIPGESTELAVRVAGDLVVDAVEGRLTGFENHARGFRLDAGVQPLGTVTKGVGDGRGVDGVRHGSILGTRLHGPVLARNPALADAVLATAFGRPIRPSGPTAEAADRLAAVVAARSV